MQSAQSIFESPEKIYLKNLILYYGKAIHFKYV